MAAWVLPDHIADVLPSEARHIEELRRLCLDTARGFGYELVMPPMLEHLASLMSGNNAGLDLQTFKMVDQLSGRTLGLRIDTTPQVARIDAHLLNRAGVTRLCYCGPVLHTKPLGPYATREPLQLGAEIYGHAGLEADLEILQLTLQCLRASHLASFHIDLSDARILPALLKGQSLSADQTKAITDALTHKDISAMRELTAQLPQALGQALQALVQMYGDLSVLQTARVQFAAWPAVLTALDQLAWLASHIDHPVSIDLADLRGYAYYSGPRFSVFVPESSDALVRGGRYDEVGAVFGRKRPAVGFSLDIKALVGLLPHPQPQAAIRAPWRDDAVLVATIAQLRAQGHTVVCMLPGHDSEVDEFECDRELVDTSGGWTVQPLRQQ
ncbi:HisZ ATP phosphoribosyltransferase involved in histidine biosynthesis [Burkholderiaceae bacterium]